MFLYKSFTADWHYYMHVVIGNVYNPLAWRASEVRRETKTKAIGLSLRSTPAASPMPRSTPLAQSSRTESSLSSTAPLHSGRRQSRGTARKMPWFSR